MVTAAIAFEALKQSDPEALSATVALLHEHPHFGTMFRPQIEKRRIQAEEQDLYLFMLAARWADDIRGKEEYDRGRWHYINIPYKPVGQPNTVKSRRAPRINNPHGARGECESCGR